MAKAFVFYCRKRLKSKNKFLTITKPDQIVMKFTIFPEIEPPTSRFPRPFIACWKIICDWKAFQINTIKTQNLMICRINQNTNMFNQKKSKNNKYIVIYVTLTIYALSVFSIIGTRNIACILSIGGWRFFVLK